MPNVIHTLYIPEVKIKNRDKYNTHHSPDHSGHYCHNRLLPNQSHCFLHYYSHYCVYAYGAW